MICSNTVPRATAAIQSIGGRARPVQAVIGELGDENRQFPRPASGRSNLELSLIGYATLLKVCRPKSISP